VFQLFRWILIFFLATFFVDNFLLTYNVSCSQDRSVLILLPSSCNLTVPLSTTGEFCDPQFLAWANQSYLTTAQNCSDCWLGVQALMMDSPLGYDPDLASNLAYLTSSCNATVGYGFTTPTAYALNSTATTVPPSVTASPLPTCTGAYTVEATDDCNSVAQSLNVSTYDLLISNNLDLYCQNFATAINSTLCIPAACETYVWQALDSCDSVVRTLSGVTVPQFLSWNPNFNDLCQNSLSYVGYVVCLR
jgi:hypothetical protein